MSYLMPLAKPTDYIRFGARYRLSGNGYLALPGAVTDDPDLGAKRYNESLLNHYFTEREPVRFRISETFSRFASNRRVIQVNKIISIGEPFEIEALSSFEKYLFLNILSTR